MAPPLRSTTANLLGLRRIVVLAEPLPCGIDPVSVEVVQGAVGFIGLVTFEQIRASKRSILPMPSVIEFTIFMSRSGRMSASTPLAWFTPCAKNMSPPHSFLQIRSQS